ncbi:class I adenylate-forming enzyme family protein [Salininema proteolyticum]|uniref:Class I adenylate-forming enzyme family protein n=1 Tax=Salininema proteolyticum TaxID=1607685 RepID=A0ABV8U1D5_9ACTN
MTDRYAKLRLHVDGEQVTPSHLARTVDHATRLLRDCGAEPGRGVLAPLSNGVAFVVAAAAAHRLGAPLVLRSPYSRTEGLPLAAETDDTGNRADPVAVKPLRPAADPFPEETTLVCPTSGSTGDPKLALFNADGQDHQNRATAARLRYGPDDGLCLPLPLNHAYGFSVMGTAAHAGASLWLEPGGGVTALTARVRNREVTSLDGVPGLYRTLIGRLRDPAGIRSLQALRVRGCGGEILPRALEDRYRDLDAPLHNGYGLTEAGPNVAVNHRDRPVAGTAGPPLDGTETRIDPETGELSVRSPSLSIGYHGPDTLPLTDGWLATGDRAEWRNGGLALTGRLSERLKIMGETVILSDLEAAVGYRPPVERTALAALPDHRGEQRLHALVEAPGDADLSAWSNHLRAMLPPRLRPRSVRRVTALPLLPNGKLDRARISAALYGRKEAQ